MPSQVTGPVPARSTWVPTIWNLLPPPSPPEAGKRTRTRCRQQQEQRESTLKNRGSVGVTWMWTWIDRLHLDLHNLHNLFIMHRCAATPPLRIGCINRRNSRSLVLCRGKRRMRKQWTLIET
jgi:hypothetical protein